MTMRGDSRGSRGGGGRGRVEEEAEAAVAAEVEERARAAREAPPSLSLAPDGEDGYSNSQNQHP